MSYLTSLLSADFSMVPIVVGMGIGIVFLGLIIIIGVCYLMGILCREKKVKAVEPEAVAKETDTAPKEASVSPEFVAAISVAIAEDLGVDASTIRILSIKKV